MGTNQALQVILGTGQVGQAVQRELTRRGASIRMVNRSGKAPAGLPAGIEVLAADLYRPEEVRRVVQGASVVYYTVQPSYMEWPEKFPALNASIIQGMTGSSATLVMADNLYMYGDVDGPIHEGLPYAAKTRKGSARARVDEALLEAHRKGDLRVVIGRASDFFGPGVTASFVGESVFGSLVQGKAANVMGNPDLPHTFTYVEDFGRALVVLGEHESALGQAWHVPNSQTVTTRQFTTAAARALGVKPRMMVAGPVMMRILSLFVPYIRELIELEYEVMKPYQVDDSKFKQAFGDLSTPLETAIQQTADWYRSCYPLK